MPVPLWQDPYANQTIDLIQARAKAQADAARQIAEYQAKAAETIGSAQASAQIQTGQAWGNAINQAGQAIGQIPGQVAQLQNQQSLIKSRDQENQLRQVQLDQANALKAGQQKIDAMQAGDQLPAGDAGPRQPSFQTPEGLWDIPKMSQALASGGSAHLAPDLLKGAETMNDSITKHQQLEMQLGQQTQLMIGDAASGALKLSKMGMAIPDAMDFVIKPVLTTGRIAPAAYAKVRDQIAALPPDQQEAALTSLMDAAAKLDKGETLGKDASHIDRYGRVTATNVVPEPFKGDYTGPDGIRYHADGTPVTGKAMAPQAPPVKSQEAEFALDGKNVKGDYIPGENGQPGRYFYKGEDVTGRALSKPPAAVIVNNQIAGQKLPDWALTGKRPTSEEANQYDATIGMTNSGLFQAAVNYLTTNHFPPTGLGQSTRAQMQRSAITSKAGAIADETGIDQPEFKNVNDANRGSLVKMQATADQVQSFINTADANATLLRGALEKIPDWGSAWLNKPIREWDSKVLSNPDMAAFKTYLASVQNEYTRVINTAGGTMSGVISDTARKEGQNLIDGDQTVKSQLASLNALKNEGANRVTSQLDQIVTIRNRMKGSTHAGQQAEAPPAPGTAPAATPPPPAALPPPAAGRIRVVNVSDPTHPVGATATMPATGEIPAGWRKQ